LRRFSQSCLDPYARYVLEFLESILSGAVIAIRGEGNGRVSRLDGSMLWVFGVGWFRFGRRPIGGSTDTTAHGEGAVAISQGTDGARRSLRVGAGGCIGSAGSSLTRAGTLSGLAEETVTGHGDGTDDQDPDEPNHNCDEDGDDADEGSASDDGIAEGLVVENGNGDSPPGEHGVHDGSQHPGCEKIPDFGRFITALFWGEEAGDSGEVDAAESDGENGGPTDSHEFETTEEIGESEVRGGVVEDLESQQSGDDEGAEDQASLEFDTTGEERDRIQHDKPPEKERVGR